MRLPCQAFDFAISDTWKEAEPIYGHLEWLRTRLGTPILIGIAEKLNNDLTHGKNSTGQRSASIPASSAQINSRIGSASERIGTGRPEKSRNSARWSIPR